jgi:uncharacterized protein YndB with AHSA1/START domain
MNMQSEIKHTWNYEQSPAEVWDYLTKAELIALWLMPNNFKAELGCEFEFRINPIPSLGLDGIMNCKILEILPFQKLSYTWKAGPGNGIYTLNTLVEWTLEPNETGTRLLLKHTGFNGENISILSSMTVGWDKNIQKMITYLTNKKNVNTNA